MTAILCLVQDAGVTIYTDGAAYDEAGLFQMPSQKVQIILHHPSVLAAKGSAYAAQFLKSFMPLTRSFDDWVASVASHMQNASRLAFELLGDPVNLAAVFGGWSEREQKFQAFYIWIAGDDPDTLKEGSLMLNELTQPFVTPSPDKAILESSGLRRNEAGQPIVFDGNEALITYMECQRQTVTRMHPGSDLEGCIVGAFIQKTILVRERASTEIIHRWPDKIGEPLNYSGAAS
jgi:hypothetical protein